MSFPRGGEEFPAERRISSVFDWLQAPFAGWGHFLGDYEGLITERDSVRPILVEANDNQPLDSTDAYSGRLRPPTAVTTRVPAATPHTVAPHPRTPHASLTVRLVPPVAYAPGPWGARHPSKCRHKLVRWGW
ncbi:hypothetical protein [Streptomyces violascens]|uniref:hypothetical protein n=1 Tax=Streptomyces violascens TaxID=67381 RepID=UPI0036B89469